MKPKLTERSDVSLMAEFDPAPNKINMEFASQKVMYKEEKK